MPHCLFMLVAVGTRCVPPWRAGARGKLALAAALVAVSGCASLTSRATLDQVVRSREMASRGIDASQHGRHAEAEALFDSAIKMCPNDEQPRRHYAESLWKRGAADEAAAHMQAAAQLSGGSPELLVRLGEMNLGRGQIDLAGQAAAKAIAGDRQLASAWALQAEVERRRGEREAALASYHRALSLAPSHGPVHMAVAQVYRELGKPQRALASLQALAEHVPPGEESVEMLHLQGLVLRDMKRLDAAADALSLAASRPAPSVELLYDLAETQLLAGRLDRATSAAEQALALAPAHGPSRELLARVQSHQQRVAATIDRAPAPR